MGNYSAKLAALDTVTALPDGAAEFMIGDEDSPNDVINRTSKENRGIIEQLVDGAIGQNLLPNSDFRTWSTGASAAPDGWTLQGGGSVARSADEKRGNYAAEITYSASDTYLESDSEPAYVYFQGNEVTVGFWVKSSTAAIARIIIDDGVGTSASGYHTGGGAYELLEVTRTLDGAASKLTVELHVEGAGSAKFDAGKLQEGEIATAFSPNSKVVQIANTQTGAVNTGTTQIPKDDSIPQNTEGDEYMTLEITPTSTTNKLLIEVVVNLAHSTDAPSLIAALFQDATANALAVGAVVLGDNANEMIQIVFRHYMTAGTTSSTTFKVRAGHKEIGTTTFNGIGGVREFGGVLASSITITELSP